MIFIIQFLKIKHKLYIASRLASNLPIKQTSGCAYVYIPSLLLFFKDIYCTASIHSEYKDKLQNCYCKQFQ